MKKVSRILAAISGSLSISKRDRKVAKANRVVDNAIDNSNNAIEDLKEGLERTLSKLAKDEIDVEQVISELAELKSEIEEQEETIKVLKWIKDYINEEVEVEDEKK